MRSYRQYCSFARGLDIVGDRWILLIVRELLQGPRRYNELLHGLPGIATNLLAERLQDLAEAGVLERGTDHTSATTAWGEWLGELDVAERLRGLEIPGRPGVLRPPPHALREPTTPADLALVRSEGRDLPVDRSRDVEPDIRVAGSEQEYP